VVIDRYAPQSSFGRVGHDDADKLLLMCGVLLLVRFSIATYLAWPILRECQDKLAAQASIRHVMLQSILRESEAFDQPRFFAYGLEVDVHAGVSISDVQ